MAFGIEMAVALTTFSQNVENTSQSTIQPKQSKKMEYQKAVNKLELCNQKTWIPHSFFPHKWDVTFYGIIIVC